MDCEKVALFFKGMSDPTRLRILMAMINGEKTVKEISEETGISSSLVSCHLTKLKNSKLIKTKKEGIYLKCSIADEYVLKILKLTQEYLSDCEANE